MGSLIQHTQQQAHPKTRSKEACLDGDTPEEKAEEKVKRDAEVVRILKFITLRVLLHFGESMHYGERACTWRESMHFGESMDFGESMHFGERACTWRESMHFDESMHFGESMQLARKHALWREHALSEKACTWRESMHFGERACTWRKHALGESCTLVRACDKVNIIGHNYLITLITESPSTRVTCIYKPFGPGPFLERKPHRP